MVRQVKSRDSNVPLMPWKRKRPFGKHGVPSLVAQTVRNASAVLKLGSSLGGKIPWRGWQPTPGFLPRESPWTEKPSGLESMGSQRVGHDWATKHCTCGKHETKNLEEDGIPWFTLVSREISCAKLQAYHQWKRIDSCCLKLLHLW